MEYNFREIEQKWQAYWNENKTYKTGIKLNINSYPVAKIYFEEGYFLFHSSLSYFNSGSNCNKEHPSKTEEAEKKMIMIFYSTIRTQFIHFL